MYHRFEYKILNYIGKKYAKILALMVEQRDLSFDRKKHNPPWLIHVNVWQKPLQYCKVISLQLKLIN